MYKEVDGVAYREIATVECSGGNCKGYFLPHSVFLGNDGSLRLEGFCSTCKQSFIRTFPCDLLQSMRPAAPTQPLLMAGPAISDATLMKMMKISYDPSEDPPKENDPPEEAQS